MQPQRPTDWHHPCLHTIFALQERLSLPQTPGSHGIQRVNNYKRFVQTRTFVHEDHVLTSTPIFLKHCVSHSISAAAAPALMNTAAHPPVLKGLYGYASDGICYLCICVMLTVPKCWFLASCRSRAQIHILIANASEGAHAQSKQHNETWLLACTELPTTATFLRTLTFVTCRRPREWCRPNRRWSAAKQLVYRGQGWGAVGVGEGCCFYHSWIRGAGPMM